MLNNPYPGQNNAVEYMVSAVPWLTASTAAAGTAIRHDLANVASTFIIVNRSAVPGADLSVGFSANGVAGSNKMVVKSGEARGNDFRFRSIFLMNPTTSSIDYELTIGLTGIPSQYFPDLTGSAGIG